MTTDQFERLLRLLLRKAQKSISDLEGAIRMGEKAMNDFPEWSPPFDLEELRVTLWKMKRVEKYVRRRVELFQ